MYRYLFLCKMYPKSGMDLARQNKSLNTLKKYFEKTTSFEGDLKDEILISLSRYIQDNDGFVLDVIPILSDAPISDSDEAMVEIRKNYRGAEFIRYIEIPSNYPLLEGSHLQTELIGLA